MADNIIDDMGKTTRRQAMAGASGGLLGLLSAPLFYELFFDSSQNLEEGEHDISENINQTRKNLESRDYTHFNTEELIFGQDNDSSEVYLGVEVNFAEEVRFENVIDALNEENYLSEGSEIFEIYASEFLEMDEVEYIELGYRSDSFDEEVTYGVEMDELQDYLSKGRSLSEFYRETASSNIGIS